MNCCAAILADRADVGDILRESGVPTIELRASIIIGSGSLSFELIRALVDKLPFMITPRWLSSLWLGLFTPIYARVGRKLIENLRNETVVSEGSAPELLGVKPRGV